MKTEKSCRICKQKTARKVAEYQPYVDYNYDVFECSNCGCRFVWRGEEVHEELHKNQNSPYSSYIKLAKKVKHLWDKGDTNKLRKMLSKTTKYKYIIDKISEEKSKEKNILEVGCSQGYLLAYFLLEGYNVLGVDISKTAIEKSISYFGKHFQVINNKNFFSSLGEFDIIFHVGTIGCVNDPIHFTNKLIKILKPGGKLLFNSPDLEALHTTNEIWASTPPPDLITIFPEFFWNKFFRNSVEMEITYEPYGHNLNLKKHLTIMLGKSNASFNNNSLFNASIPSNKSVLHKSGNYVIEIATNATKYFLPRYKNEYGMFISMKKIT